MSESEPSKVFLFDNSDPEMQAAYVKARTTFRYFWREVAWERRRIVPALNLSCVKVPFSDGEQATGPSENPQVEHMWIAKVDFDGQMVSGVLLNAPNWLKTVKEGDSARVPIAEISDWMYAIGNDVYGAYTVNLLRSRMAPAERRSHDDAWGLNFGDPTDIRIAPETKKSGGFFKSLFGKPKAEPESEEHPMSIAMASSLKEQLAKDPSMLSARDSRGWTLLHQEALAGSAATVKILLDAGADRNAPTDSGMTPLQLAQSLHWEKVVALLT